ncbi:MAG: FxsA family protein [Corynebacterium sp.]|nr:FxsA family protein [Corynebacterium sp.]
MKIFFGYLLVEALTFYAFATWLGVGWALVLLIACFFGGLLLAAAQMRSIATTLLRGGASPGRAAGDLGLVGTGSLLVAMPGIFTSIMGLLLIIPLTRAVVRKSVAKKLRVSLENFGMRSFERAAAYRPQANFGSFHSQSASTKDADSTTQSGATNPPGSSRSEQQRLEEEIRRWSEHLRPEDFSTSDPQDSGSGKADVIEGEVIESSYVDEAKQEDNRRSSQESGDHRDISTSENEGHSPDHKKQGGKESDKD